MPDYNYYKEALKNVTKPCAFLDLDVLAENIHDITGKSNNKKIRIASKSIRSVAVLKTILNASPVFQGIMCFTADEAVYLNGHGFDDLLIAYPVWDTYHLKQIAKLRRDNHIITVMIDSIDHIDRLEKVAKAEHCTFLVCIDIDLSSDFFGLHFGVHRSPIKTLEHAVAIINRASGSNYLQIDGVMGYEAQIAGVTDNDPNQKAKNNVIRFLKRKSSAELIKKRDMIIKAIKRKGISLRFVNGGGTGSLHQTSRETEVTEVTVGSGFFNPGLFDYYQAFKRQPAVGFAIEITRIPTSHIYTCSGGGYIASGATGHDKQPHVYLPEGAKLIANEGAGEVQTPIYYAGKIQLTHGDPIIMRHSKAGELCERFHYLHLIQNGRIIGKYTTYRGDNQCFL
ncbi:amino acid deaminase/aldolase [Virgibacillus dakarensis]|nr:amino acid deaminase/aldolase [Virgibacillus dakarensis]